MKNKRFKFIGLSYVLILISGCGGSDSSSNSSPNKDPLSSYNEQLSQLSPASQMALKAQPIQYIDLNIYQRIQNTLQAGTPVTFIIDFTSYDVNSNEYYLYGTVTTDGNIVAENFFILDNDGTMTTRSTVTRAIGNTKGHSISEVKTMSSGNSHLYFPKTNERNDIKKLKFTLQKNQSNKVDLLDVYKDELSIQLPNNSFSMDNNLSNLIHNAMISIFLQ